MAAMIVKGPPHWGQCSRWGTGTAPGGLDAQTVSLRAGPRSAPLHGRGMGGQLQRRAHARGLQGHGGGAGVARGHGPSAPGRTGRGTPCSPRRGRRGHRVHPAHRGTPPRVGPRRHRDAPHRLCRHRGAPPAHRLSRPRLSIALDPDIPAEDAKTLRNIAPRADEGPDNAPIPGRGLA